MKKVTMTVLFLGLISSQAFAASHLNCKDQVQKAVEDNGGSVIAIKSKDGTQYTVSYFLDGGDAENEGEATVTVDPQSCEVKQVSGI